MSFETSSFSTIHSSFSCSHCSTSFFKKIQDSLSKIKIMIGTSGRELKNLNNPLEREIYITV
jgi:hypothetical protein